jgi:hypothetical protein
VSAATPSRRTVLRLALAGGVVAVAGAGGLALQPGVAREPREPLRALSPRAFAVLAAAADRLCPGAPPDLPSAWALRVPEKIDATLDRLDPASAAELGQALLLLESGLAGALLHARPRAFTALSPEAQDRALEAWRTSRFATLRKAHKALLGLVSAAYWSDPATHAFVGYPGPPRFPA